MSESLLTTKKAAQSSVLSPQSLIFVAALAGALVAAWLAASGRYREAAASAMAAVAIAFIFTARVRVETILIAWFASSPLLSYFIRIPTDKSIITFNRAMFGLAVVLLLIRRKRDKGATAKPEAQAISDGSADANLNLSADANSKLTASANSKQSINAAATRFEIAWAILSVIALASAMLHAYETAYAARIAVDAFILPLVAFRIARNHFDARGRAGLLITGAAALAFFLLAVGAYEAISGANIFQYKGSAIEREGELRVNGPFSADITFANVSLLVALFLVAAPRIFNLRLDTTARALRACAIGAGITASLLPMFRAVAAALIVGVVVLIAATSERRVAVSPRRAARRWIGVAMLAAAVGIVMFGPLAPDERLQDPRTAFGRLATWEAAAAIALEQPIVGVGFTNYGEYFYERRRQSDRRIETFESARAVNSPHSNWLWIASELGLITLALYVAANIWLFLIGYRALNRASTQQARATAACFIALVVAYWIPGLALASGSYSELNLYLFFMLGLLSNRFLVSGF